MRGDGKSEKLKDKSDFNVMAQNGGKRKGAGRPKGSKNKATLEQQAVQEAFNQRAMLHADDLFHAQFSLAVGTQRVFRIDETRDNKGNVKREHVLVTDVDEIKALLDEFEGNSGVVDDKYYYFTEVPPDNRALDSLLNRSLGKPVDKLEHSGKDGGPIESVSMSLDEWNKQAAKRLKDVDGALKSFE